MDGSRRIERERVLSLLYEAEMKGESVDVTLDALPLMPETFVVETVRGVGECTKKVDELIDAHAIGWDAERMASIDRNVLRIGVWELLERKDLSIAVIISEAVELAKRFSTEESGGFVNGVLSAVGAKVRPE